MDAGQFILIGLGVIRLLRDTPPAAPPPGDPPALPPPATTTPPPATVPPPVVGPASGSPAPTTAAPITDDTQLTTPVVGVWPPAEASPLVLQLRAAGIVTSAPSTTTEGELERRLLLSGLPSSATWQGILGVYATGARQDSWQAGSTRYVTAIYPDGMVTVSIDAASGPTFDSYGDPFTASGAIDSISSVAGRGRVGAFPAPAIRAAQVPAWDGEWFLLDVVGAGGRELPVVDGFHWRRPTGGTPRGTHRGLVLVANGERPRGWR